MNEISTFKRELRSHVYCSIVPSSQDMETTQVSEDGGVDKESMIAQWSIIQSLKRSGSCHLQQHG